MEEKLIKLYEQYTTRLKELGLTGRRIEFKLKNINDRYDIIVGQCIESVLHKFKYYKDNIILLSTINYLLKEEIYTENINNTCKYYNNLHQRYNNIIKKLKEIGIENKGYIFKFNGLKRKYSFLLNVSYNIDKVKDIINTHIEEDEIDINKILLEVNKTLMNMYNYNFNINYNKDKAIIDNTYDGEIIKIPLSVIPDILNENTDAYKKAKKLYEDALKEIKYKFWYGDKEITNKIKTENNMETKVKKNVSYICL